MYRYINKRSSQIRLLLLLQLLSINYPENHAGRRAVDDHHAGEGEQLRCHPQDEALCCCQYRTRYLLKFFKRANQLKHEDLQQNCNMI